MRFEYDVRDLGRLPYRDAWQLQLEVHAEVAGGDRPPTLLLVEHPPVLTFGRKGGRQHLLLSEDEARRRGFELFDVERGGDVTYHGPGQLVGYPIFPVGRRVREYLRALERVMVRTFETFGLDTAGSPGYAGVWLGSEKLVAIGVAVKRNVSFHGFAMNVHTELERFGAIVPCGLVDRGVTSLSRVLGRHVDLDEVKPPLLEAFHAVFHVAHAPAGAERAPKEDMVA